MTKAATAFFGAVCAALLPACQHTAPPSVETTAPVTGEAVSLHEARLLGKLVWFDTARKHGVMRLHTTHVPKAGDLVESRGDAFRPSARWEVTALRHGESIGLRLLEGNPAEGDLMTASPHTDPDGPDPGS